MACAPACCGSRIPSARGCACAMRGRHSSACGSGSCSKAGRSRCGKGNSCATSPTSSVQPSVPEFPFQPIAEYRAYKDAIDAAVLGVFESGNYILGPETAEFEKEFAAWIGGENSAHAVGVANGTDALVLAMRALGI